MNEGEIKRKERKRYKPIALISEYGKVCVVFERDKTKTRTERKKDNQAV